MQHQPLTLDWQRLRYVGSTIRWDASIYQHFSMTHVPSLKPKQIGQLWHRLPFESIQLDKFPIRAGIYALAYTYNCLSFPAQEIILYIGQASNLRKRLCRYLRDFRHPIMQDHSRPSTRKERLNFMFSTFNPLHVYYCTLEGSEQERIELERNLVGLLDPLFNWQHKPRPMAGPIIGRPGKVSVATGLRQPAFSD